MKTLLCITNTTAVHHSIHAHLGGKFRVDQELSPESALKRLKKKHYDILFADLDCFSESDKREGYDSMINDLMRFGKSTHRLKSW